jgi:biopolymer transport protein ExbD
MAELNTSEGKKKHGGKKRSKKISIRVDLTPMVDLGFLLVTFFMLTTTFSKPQTMEINLPVRDAQAELEDAPAVKASKTLTVIPGAENKVFWVHGIPGQDGAEYEVADFSIDGIRKVLLEKNASIKDLVVIIKPSDEATYRNVVDILDEMNICNIKRYALVDITPVDLEQIKDL